MRVDLWRQVSTILHFWENIVPIVRFSLSIHYLPPWHDESVVNYWFNAVEYPTVVLGPEYLLPEPPTDSWLLPQQQLYYKKTIGQADYRDGREPKLLNLGTRKATNPEIRESISTTVKDSVVIMAEEVRAFSCSSFSPTRTANAHSCMHWIPGVFDIIETDKQCRKNYMEICTMSEIQLHFKFGTALCLPGFGKWDNTLRSPNKSKNFIFTGNVLNQCDTGVDSGFKFWDAVDGSRGTSYCCRTIVDSYSKL